MRPPAIAAKRSALGSAATFEGRRPPARDRARAARVGLVGAEAASLAQGVSCADTTVTAAEMIATVDGGAASIAAAIADSSGGDPAANSCEAVARIAAEPATI